MTYTSKQNWDGYRPPYVLRLGPRAVSFWDRCMDTLVDIGYDSGDAAVLLRFEWPLMWERLDKSEGESESTGAGDGGQEPAHE